MVSTSIFAIRHTLVSLAVLVLTSGSAIGILGAVNADAPMSSGAFTFAAPMVGDHAEYTVEATSGEPRPWDNGGDTWSYTFAWGKDERIRTGDGAITWTNTMHSIDGRDDGRFAHTWYILPGTTQLVAYSYARAETTTQDDGDSLTVESSTRVFFEREAEIPCGFRTALQGQTVPIGRSSYREVFDCRASGLAIGAGDRLTLIGNGTVEGQERILVRATNDRAGERMHYWYQENIPYPTRVEEWDDGVLHRTWVMTAFARGDDPVRTTADRIDAALPTLVLAPRTPWGLDVRGVEHTFPPDEAWRNALEDPDWPELRDFLAAHPDAYTNSVYHQSLRSEGRSGHWDLWNFDVTDGVEAFDFSIRRITDVDETAVLSALVGADVSYDYSSRLEPASPFLHPPPNLVPDRVPTWASMLAVWDILKSDAYPEDGNTYYVAFRCSSDPCDDVDEHYKAGFIQYDRTYEGPASQGTTDDLRFSEVFWRNIPDRDDYSLDRPEHYHEQTQAWRAPGQAPPVTGGQSGASMATQAFAVAPGWSLPPIGVTATATGAGVLIALVHWLWPIFRTVGVGMFTRVRHDRLLDHPVRSRLMAEIAANPGIHQTELVRVAAVGKGATDMHLRRLKSGGLISVSHGKGYTCYFPKGAVDRRVIDAAPVMKSKVARALVQYVHGRPGVRATELRAVLQISPSTLHYHMKRLEEAGVIEIRQAGNGKALDLTHTGRMVAAS